MHQSNKYPLEGTKLVFNNSSFEHEPLKNYIMKTRFTPNKLIVATFILCLISFAHAQTVHTVDNNSTNAADFTSIADAISAAAPNDIIYIQHSNTGYGIVNINKPLTLIGRSHNETNYVTSLSSVNIQSSNVKLRGFYIQSGLLIQSTDGTPISNIEVKDNRIANTTNIGPNYSVDNVTLQGNVLTHIYQNTNAQNTLIMNNIIYGNIRSHNPTTFFFTQNIGWENQLYNYGDANGIMKITNSIFITSSYNQVIETTGRYKIQNSITKNYFGAYQYNFQNSSDPANILENVQLNIDPMLVNTAGTGTYDISNMDLTLANGSPAIGQGFDGEDLGIYHNYAFSEEGNAIGYPTLVIDSAPTTVPAGGDLNIRITAEAH